MTLRVYHGSIIDLNVDVIVNAANTRLLHAGGVAAAIAHAAGAELARECREIGYCAIGQAAATSGGALFAKHVIHVPTIDLEPWGKTASITDIESGARAALRLAQEFHAQSIAFPLLGAGISGLSRSEVAQTLARIAQDYAHLEIVVCAYTGADWAAVDGLGQQLKAASSGP